MKEISALQHTGAVKQQLHDTKGAHISVRNFCIPQLDFVTILSQQGRVLLPSCAATLKSWLSSKKLELELLFQLLFQLLLELALI